MRRRMISLLLLLALLPGALCSCASREEDARPVLWFAGDVTDWDGTSVALGTVPYTGALEPEAMTLALLAGPGEVGLRSPFPAGTALLGWSVENGLLRLDLSEAYGTLTGYPLTLASYCLTLTLTQLPGVERVQLTVEGRPLPGRAGEELREEQAVLSGAEERPVEVWANLYFPRTAGRGLGVEARQFQLTEGDVLAEEVMRALLAGPSSPELASAIPEGTELRSLHLDDGVCYVDLTGTLLDGLPQGEDEQLLLIYSIVDTLGNLNSINSVCLLVEGEAPERLGEVALPPVLEPDFGLTRN